MMPPLLAIVHIRPNSMHRGVRVWVPLFLIWLLLLLGSLNGMHVEVESPSAAVLIHVY